MDKAAAVEMIRKIRGMYKPLESKRTAADIRYVDTSYGKIRVLEYGFDADDVRPLYVDIHGGGYCVGLPEMDEEVNLHIRKNTDVKIISIDYPKAPENPYPIGLEAAYEVIRHYYNDAERYNIDRERIGIGGYSSGGNFATVVSIKAKERGDLKIRYQILCYPASDVSQDPHTGQGSSNVLSGDFREAIRLCYISKPEHATEPYASPRLATTELLTGLPPALLISAGMDPLYPSYTEYGTKLREAGVDIDVRNFEKADHGFTYLGNSEDKMRAFGLIVDFINRHTRP
ncbi:MAG: alpha/beta hydrolase [Methanomassiliicoccaceae archaeon]|jgi:acetyl esterase|nr:alpha/beta hydrolase [Methanomassiliicoccaceae archaeon]